MSRRRKEARGLEERRWRGIVVSEGVVVGRVLRIHNGAGGRVYRATLDESEVEPEARRLRVAVRLVRRQLLAVKKNAERALGSEHAYIFDAHLLMLEDRKFLEDIEGYIRRERVNAEWAVKVVADRLLAIYREIKDEYLRERGSDVEDVMRRMLVALSGERAEDNRLTEDAVVVAAELMPSTAAELDFAHVKAIATDAGGWTSHTAIIARGMGVPTLVGLRDLYEQARTGDEIIVDAQEGLAILHPSDSTAEHYRTKLAQSFDATRRDSTDASSASTSSSNEGSESALSSSRDEPLLTLDGVEVFLRANVELPAEYEGVRRYGARGIGLYRSEFLLSQRGSMPSEDEQRAAYTELARLGGSDGATIRLFDLGGDKIGGGVQSGDERNPALGLRAIRFCLTREDVLRTQARAVLRAASEGRLSLVLPMISDVMEVRRARRIIEEERQRLREAGQAVGEVRLGAMIEVPSAVLVAERLAREVDFFSLGTNDLIQYLLAVDRSNEEVADWFRSLHPAVLESIRRTLRAAEEARIPVNVCGEMAARPVYAFILVGLGARDLSMTASSIPRVRRTLAGIEAERARALAAECLECSTADEVEQLVRVRLGAEYPHLFSPEILPAPKS
ncbi:MAG TPA: phosphoenolpyruvate--protein phosphotransferase [Pyrinomonadaceae bacterium]